MTELAELFSLAIGVDLGAWLRAFARVAPVLFLVPAFGGAALPAPARLGLGLSLALSIGSSLHAEPGAGLPSALELAREVALGLPLAVGAALLVHTALMAGGVIDELRGHREASTLPLLDGGATPIGALLGLLVIVAFHAGGGPSRLVAALSAPVISEAPLLGVVTQVSASIGIAVAAAAPVAVAAIVLSVAEALLARAATPAHVGGLVAPLRGVALLAIAALVLDRVLAFLLAASRW